VKNISNALSGATGTSFGLTDAQALAGATGAQAFKSTDANGVVTTTSVTLGAAGTYKTVDDVAKALNGDSAFSGKFTASVVHDVNGVATGLKVVANDGSAVDTTAPSGSFAAAGTVGAGGGLDFSSAAGAQNAITILDQKITSVSTARAQLGASQNRFEHTINNLNVSKENLTASASRITDTDMASEMVNYSRANILSQAGTAMLAQANHANDGVLQLLR
jgi:flagellin